MTIDNENEDIHLLSDDSLDCDNFYQIESINSHLNENFEAKIKGSLVDEEFGATGYKVHFFQLLFFHFFGILTVGFLYLLVYWKPEWRVIITSRKSALRHADTLILKSTDDVIHVVKVKNENFSEIYSDFHQYFLSFDNELTIRYFEFEFMKFMWNVRKGQFECLLGIGAKTPVQTVLKKFKGYSHEERFLRQKIFGKNHITINVESYLKLLFTEVLNPFYIFQIASLILWAIDEYYLYAMCIFIISCLSIVVSLIETRKQSESLKNMVESSNENKTLTLDKPDVLKHGPVVKIDSCELVPGDVISIPPAGCILSCDAVLVSGNAIVNESMLTGESVPVTKTPLMKCDERQFYSPEHHKRHTLFCGTSVIQTRYYDQEQVLAVVVRTGFSTAKGELVRSILYPRSIDFKFYKDAIKFIGILFCVSVIGMAYTVYVYIEMQESIRKIIVRALDIVTIVVPPALPAAMTVGTYYAQNRLKKLGIFCISPPRINVSGKVKLFCFDKTGTLTEDGLEVWGVSETEINDEKLQMTKEKTQNPHVNTKNTINKTQNTIEKMLNTIENVRNSYDTQNNVAKTQNVSEKVQKNIEKMQSNDKTLKIDKNSLSSDKISSHTNFKLAFPTRRIDLLDPRSKTVAALATCHSLMYLNGELTGDPLDLSMFKSTNWELVEPEHDAENFDSLIPTIVRPACKIFLEPSRNEISSTLQNIEDFTKKPKILEDSSRKSKNSEQNIENFAIKSGNFNQIIDGALKNQSFSEDFSKALINLGNTEEHLEFLGNKSAKVTKNTETVNANLLISEENYKNYELSLDSNVCLLKNHKMEKNFDNKKAKIDNLIDFEGKCEVMKKTSHNSSPIENYAEKCAEKASCLIDLDENSLKSEAFLYKNAEKTKHFVEECTNSLDNLCGKNFKESTSNNLVKLEENPKSLNPKNKLEDIKKLSKQKSKLEENGKTLKLVSDASLNDLHLCDNAPQPHSCGILTIEQVPYEIGLVREFPFSSSLQRMSVIVRVLGKPHMEVFAKGAPEIIQKLCTPESLPNDLSEILSDFAVQGYRVIALAHKNLSPKVTWHAAQRGKRNKFESDLSFLGLLIMQNVLKPETAPIIAQFKRAHIRTVMVTGDNILTGLSVARDCGMVNVNEKVYMVQVHENDGKMAITFVPTAQYDRDNSGECDGYIVKDTSDTRIDLLPEYHLAVSGPVWASIRTYFPEYVPYILSNGTVFGRMSPDQKVQLVEEFQAIGHTVGMCGDGANDCGALKAAHVGISLSEAEASVAAPFTSHIPNISCVPKVICEGRGALTTNFSLFKYMALYSIIQFVSVLILYTYCTNLSDPQFLYIDLFIVTLVAIFMGYTKSRHVLVPERPLSNLIGCVNLFSLFSQIVFVILSQIFAFYYLKLQPWYKDPESVCKKQRLIGEDISKSWETTVIFCISAFQYLSLGVIYSPGHPFRKPIYTNFWLIFTLIIFTSTSLLMLMYPPHFIESFMELKSFPLEPQILFRGTLFAIAVLHLLLGWSVEYFIASSKNLKKVFRLFKPKKEPKNLYKKIKIEMENDGNWPPTNNCVYAKAYS